MPRIREEEASQEAVIFSRAVENVFRKLVRLLLGRMTFTRAQEIMRSIFVEEAEKRLQAEHPQKTPSLTKLGLLTGLDTRTLTKVRSEMLQAKTHSGEQRFFRDVTPEAGVLDYWSSNRKYIDRTSGEPLVLKLRGEAPSFEALTKEIGLARGVTPKSLLASLLRSEAIEVNSSTGEVVMLNSKFLPFKMKGMAEALAVGLIVVGKLIDTLLRNVESVRSGADPFFQRSNWTHRLNREHVKEFREKVRQALFEAQEKSIAVMEPYENDEIAEDQITAGISIFYFEDDPENAGLPE